MGGPVGPRLLVVDDEPAIGAALRLMLDGLYEVVAVTGGEAALALLGGPEPFDAVLCDLNLPNTRPGELAQSIGRLRPALTERVVFMTGGALAAPEQSLLDSVPAERWLLKPFRQERLLEVLVGLGVQPAVG